MTPLNVLITAASRRVPLLRAFQTALRHLGDPGRVVGQRGNDPAMKMTEELQQIVPARQGDFGTARLNGDDAETGGVAKALRVDGLGEALRVQVGAQGAGPFVAVYLAFGERGARRR